MPLLERVDDHDPGDGAGGAVRRAQEDVRAAGRRVGRGHCRGLFRRAGSLRRAAQARRGARGRGGASGRERARGLVERRLRASTKTADGVRRCLIREAARGVGSIGASWRGMRGQGDNPADKFGVCRFRVRSSTLASWATVPRLLSSLGQALLAIAGSFFYEKRQHYLASAVFLRWLRLPRRKGLSRSGLR